MPFAYFQIERLRSFLARPGLFSAGDRENVAAGLKAYRDGSLILEPGATAYWYGRIQKENPGPLTP
jgi:hypothetical protein